MARSAIANGTCTMDISLGAGFAALGCAIAGILLACCLTRQRPGPIRVSRLLAGSPSRSSNLHSTSISSEFHTAVLLPEILTALSCASKAPLPSIVAAMLASTGVELASPARVAPLRQLSSSSSHEAHRPVWSQLLANTIDAGAADIASLVQAARNDITLSIHALEAHSSDGNSSRLPAYIVQDVLRQHIHRDAQAATATALLVWAWLRQADGMRYTQALSVLAATVVPRVMQPRDDGHVEDADGATHDVLVAAVRLLDGIIVSFLGDLQAQPDAEKSSAAPNAETARMSAVSSILAFWHPRLYCHMADLGLQPELWAPSFLTTLGFDACNTDAGRAAILNAMASVALLGPHVAALFPCFLAVAALISCSDLMLSCRDDGSGSEGLAALQRMKSGQGLHWDGVLHTAVVMMAWSPPSLTQGVLPSHAAVRAATGLPDKRAAASPSTAPHEPHRARSSSSPRSTGSFSGIVSGVMGDEEAGKTMAEAMGQAGHTVNAVPRVSLAADVQSTTTLVSGAVALREAMAAWNRAAACAAVQPSLQVSTHAAAPLSISFDRDSRAMPLLAQEAVPSSNIEAFAPEASPLPTVSLFDIASHLLDVQGLAKAGVMRVAPHSSRPNGTGPNGAPERTIPSVKVIHQLIGSGCGVVFLGIHSSVIHYQRWKHRMRAKLRHVCTQAACATVDAVAAAGGARSTSRHEWSAVVEKATRQILDRQTAFLRLDLASLAGGTVAKAYSERQSRRGASLDSPRSRTSTMMPAKLLREVLMRGGAATRHASSSSSLIQDDIKYFEQVVKALCPSLLQHRGCLLVIDPASGRPEVDDRHGSDAAAVQGPAPLMLLLRDVLWRAGIEAVAQWER